MAPGHVYYVGIQQIFTVRPHSQLRRNLLESDGSGASRNNLTTPLSSLSSLSSLQPPSAPEFFFNQEGISNFDLHDSHSHSIENTFNMVRS